MAGAQLSALVVMLVGASRTYEVSIRDLLGLRGVTVLHHLRQARQALRLFQG